MTDHVHAVQAAAVDRVLAAADPGVARRHLALIAALDPIRDDPAADDRLAAATAVLLAVRGVSAVSSGSPRLPEPPAPASPDAPATEAPRAALAAEGAAVAHLRLDAPLDRLAAGADLAPAAVRAALARR